MDFEKEKESLSKEPFTDKTTNNKKLLKFKVK